MNASLTNVGVLISNKDLTYNDRQLITKQLTIKVKTFAGWIKKTKGYTVNNDYLIIPRFAMVVIKKPIKLNMKNKLNRGRRCMFPKFLAVLTSNQTTVMYHVMNNYYTDDMRTSGMAGVIVNMPPGEGKTFLALGLIHLLGRKTAIIVPNTYLLQQWYNLCLQYFPDTSIGMYYSDKKVDGDIVIIVINSALSDEFIYAESIHDKNKRTATADKWWSRFGLTVYDEVHMYCSESRAEIFQYAQTQYMLGLSATPDQRIDKLDPLAIWNVGSVLNLCDIDGFAENKTEYKTDVRVIKYKCETEYAEIEISDTGTVSVPKMINNFILDPTRNTIIVQEAMRLYQLGLCIFIFTDRRSHAHYIVDTLKQYQYEFGRNAFYDLFPVNKLNTITKDIIYDYLYPEEMNVTTLLGGANEADIYEAKTFSRIIVTTYAYSSTGVSIDKLNAAILATPRKNCMTQILGRIYRLAGDSTITRRIVDLVDWNTPLKKQYYVRRKVYSSKSNTNIEIVEH